MSFSIEKGDSKAFDIPLMIKALTYPAEASGFA